MLARPHTTDAVTPAVLAALGLLILAGMAAGGFGFARVRLQRPSPWVPPAIAEETRTRELLIEAELQEIVAEERARAASTEPVRDAEADPERKLVGPPG